MGNFVWQLLAIEDTGEGSTFQQGLLNVLMLIMIACGTLLVFYAIFLFFLMATASDANKRNKAKRRVINAACSILIVVALIAMLQGLKITIGAEKSSENAAESGNTTLITDAFSKGTFSKTLTITGEYNKTTKKYTLAGSVEIKPSDVSGLGGRTLTTVTAATWVSGTVSNLDVHDLTSTRNSSGSVTINYSAVVDKVPSTGEFVYMLSVQGEVDGNTATGTLKGKLKIAIGTIKR